MYNYTAFEIVLSVVAFLACVIIIGLGVNKKISIVAMIKLVMAVSSLTAVLYYFANPQDMQRIGHAVTYLIGTAVVITSVRTVGPAILGIIITAVVSNLSYFFVQMIV